MTVTKLLPSPKPEVTDRPVFSDQEIDQYMQTAARMLYDIIREWRERHPESGRQTDQNNNLGKRKKDI